MADARWDVPETEEGLRTLLTQLSESRAAGDDAAVGWGLVRLAHLVKWVRSDNDEPPFVRAGTLATEAIATFQRAGDERGLLVALRMPATFLDPEEVDRRLDEAMALAERLGDERAIAQTLAARGRSLGMRDREASIRVNREALERFRALDDKRGQAGCLFSLSISDGDAPLKYERALEAARLYRESGDFKMAAMMASVALTNGEEFLPIASLEPIARQGLADAQTSANASSEGMLYGSLAKIAAAKGETEEVAKLQRWQLDLQESDGLTPKERRVSDIAMTRQLIAVAKASGQAETVAMFENELRKLKKSRP